jgi:hypothetical protein
MSKQDHEQMIRHMTAMLRHMKAFNELMEKFLMEINELKKQ